MGRPRSNHRPTNYRRRPNTLYVSIPFSELDPVVYMIIVDIEVIPVFPVIRDRRVPGPVMSCTPRAADRPTYRRKVFALSTRDSGRLGCRDLSKLCKRYYGKVTTERCTEKPTRIRSLEPKEVLGPARELGAQAQASSPAPDMSPGPPCQSPDWSGYNNPLSTETVIIIGRITDRWVSKPCFHKGSAAFTSILLLGRPFYRIRSLLSRQEGFSRSGNETGKGLQEM
ncbi:hypothetical protein J6590_003573 [Homalodisca vitripennis]|nr:hypothetical protein J6590_003573 [Homalodisca vitripennis]